LEKHKMHARLTLIFFLGAIAVSFHPVHSRMVQLTFLGCLVGGWIGLTMLVWKRKALRAAALLVPLILAIPFLLPGGKIISDELREDYVRRMGGFEGVKYHWGGESARGIDCSGLPRRAFRDALLSYGFRHLNGRAFRHWAEQWWLDASAKALGESYRGYTVPMGTTGTIRDMSYDALVPGDLAVTTNGLHVLAYAGDGRWIQADPGIGAVATLDGRTSDNGWFKSPVTTHQWSLLDQP
jgi:hypothetical protein